MALNFFFDVKRCSGCQACIVACLDQNDLFDKKRSDFWRQVHKVEDSTSQENVIRYVSLACMHCEESPCLLGCPTGAIYRDDKTGVIGVNQANCIGCHSCSLACPFGVPRFNQQGKMEKCQMCQERIVHGMEPACVRVCPTKALQFGEVNELGVNVSEKAASRMISGIR